jgi:hypothetical protein
MNRTVVAVATVIALLAVFTFQGRRSHAAAEMRALPRSIAASEAQLIDFRHEVRAASRNARSSDASSRVAAVHACNYPPAPRNVKRVETTLLSLQLPADFERGNVELSDRNAASSGYSRYDWKAPDGSTVRIGSANSDAVHTDWTGLIVSECDVSVGGLPVHVDVANASGYSPNVVIHGHFRTRSGLSVKFVGHARSAERQAELLHALRTLSISSRWGASR